MMQHAVLEDTVYFWFASNNTSGSGDDGASAAADVRLAGAAAGAAPVLSPSPTLLSHANYPAGCYEVAVAATAANGFASGNTYAVFCTLAVDSQNPSGFIGAFKLDPIIANMVEISGDSTAADNAEADYDGTGYNKSNSTIGTCTTNTDMRGTDSAATAANLATAQADLDTIDTVVDAIKAKTDNLPGAIPKNVALSDFTFLMVQSSDHVTPATGLTVAATISQDGGAFGACTNSVTEISNGFYKIDLTQAEMNADIVALKFTAASADQRSITIKTDS